MIVASLFPVVSLSPPPKPIGPQARALIHDDGLDLGAAQIDADAHRYGSTHTAA